MQPGVHERRFPGPTVAHDRHYLYVLGFPCLAQLAQLMSPPVKVARGDGQAPVIDSIVIRALELSELIAFRPLAWPTANVDWFNIDPACEYGISRLLLSFRAGHDDAWIPVSGSCP